MGMVLDSRDLAETVREMAQLLLDAGTPEARQQFDALITAFLGTQQLPANEERMPDADRSAEG